jgi:uncharacterized membrane protein
MKQFGRFMTRTLLAGLLAIAPVYLAILLILKAMSSLGALVRPLAAILPESLPAERLLSLLLDLIVVFAVGLAIRSTTGRRAWERITTTLFSKLPGYALFKSLTQRLAGGTEGEEWKPVLAEIEEALVPGFIIEELTDGRLTVFVPSVPTPLAGAVYILTPNRVHRVDVPFTRAISVVSRWGSGCGELVAATNGTATYEVR